MEKYNVTVHFRCTPEEKEKIGELAAKEHKAKSAYLRDAALNRNIPKMDPDTTKILKELQENELKIGVNINQAVRLCNAKKSVSRDDYELLTDMLLRILEYRRKLSDLLIERAVGG